MRNKIIQTNVLNVKTFPITDLPLGLGLNFFSLVCLDLGILVPRQVKEQEENIPRSLKCWTVPSFVKRKIVVNFWWRNCLVNFLVGICLPVSCLGRLKKTPDKINNQMQMQLSFFYTVSPRY